MPDQDIPGAAQRAHLRKLYAEIFEDDKRGQAVLADLYARFVHRPNPNDYSREGMLKAFVQTHQREVVEYIVRQINAAHDVPELTSPEGTDDDPA